MNVKKKLVAITTLGIVSLSYNSNLTVAYASEDTGNKSNIFQTVIEESKNGSDSSYLKSVLDKTNKMKVQMAFQEALSQENSVKQKLDNAQTSYIDSVIKFSDYFESTTISNVFKPFNKVHANISCKIDEILGRKNICTQKYSKDYRFLTETRQTFREQLDELEDKIHESKANKPLDLMSNYVDLHNKRVSFNQKVEKQGVGYLDQELLKSELSELFYK